MRRRASFISAPVALRTAGRFIVGGGWFEKKEGAHRPGAAAPCLICNYAFDRARKTWKIFLQNHLAMRFQE
jgi:hypothetical protein